jgi:polyphosphate kinase 2 (PPK2 family)
MQALESSIQESASSTYDVAEFRDLSYPAYRAELRALRVHLLSLQEWVISEGRRVAIVLEGRDAAGKGRLSSGITHYLNPKFSKIVAQGTPTPQAMRNWLGRHYKEMPVEGQIVVFDRSWYSRAMIQPTMGYCSMRQYHYFMNRVNEWENVLVDEGIDLIKIYLSVSQEAQDLRFRLRSTSDLQYWKYSATDRMAAERWNLLTYFKDRMFAVTSTDYAPWTIIDSDNKQQALLNAIHCILQRFGYEESGLIHPSLQQSAEEATEALDLLVDGVLFTGLNLEQVAILDRIRIHE